MSQNNDNNHAITQELSKLSKAVEALSQHVAQLAATTTVKEIRPPLSCASYAYIFDAERKCLRPIAHVVAPPLTLLMGIDRAKNTLLANTERFAKGYSANNALLWGARGMGKSTLIKSVFLSLAEADTPIALVEVHREDILALPELMLALGNTERRYILFCDDLSFNRPDRDFKALKSILEGGLDGRPENILFYATSNRRHMLPRDDANYADRLQALEQTEETVALSDRFGLWLGFHQCSQEEYLEMVAAYLFHFKLGFEGFETEALEWAKTRGNRSGRTAWQYVQDVAGLAATAIKF